MTRFLLASLFSAVCLSVASADLGPRPIGPIPPKGSILPPEKLIPVHNVLKFGNEFPNHTFWAVTRGTNGVNVVPLKPDTAKPHPLTMNLVTAAIVFAVPNDVAKTFATPKEFIAAMEANKLPAGVISSPTLVKSQAVPQGDRRASIDRMVIVTGGAKDGVKFAEEDPLPKLPGVPKHASEPDADDVPDSTADARPAPRLFVVGLFAALAVTFAGVRVARRK